MCLRQSCARYNKVEKLDRESANMCLGRGVDDGEGDVPDVECDTGRRGV